MGPYLEILRARLGSDDPVRRYRYAVRICPEPEHWGGLSGCSYTEGVSWGKFVPPAEGGRFAEVFADATIAWPLVVRAVTLALALTLLTALPAQAASAKVIKAAPRSTGAVALTFDDGWNLSACTRIVPGLISPCTLPVGNIPTGNRRVRSWRC